MSAPGPDARLVPAEVRALGRPATPALAAFDADGCLWQGDIAEDFVQHLIAQGRLSDALWPDFVRITAHDPIASCFFYLRFFIGMPMSELAALVEEFWARGAPRRWNADVIATLRHLAAEGYEVHVVSGTPAFVLAPLCRELPMVKLLGFGAEVDAAGRVTGAPHGIPTAGPGKAEAIRGVWRGPVAFAVGNSVLDTEMLALAELPWAYEPSAALAEVARARGWLMRERR